MCVWGSRLLWTRIEHTNTNTIFFSSRALLHLLRTVWISTDRQSLFGRCCNSFTTSDQIRVSFEWVQQIERIFWNELLLFFSSNWNRHWWRSRNDFSGFVLHEQIHQDENVGKMIIGRDCCESERRTTHTHTKSWFNLILADWLINANTPHCEQWGTPGSKNEKDDVSEIK